MARDSQPSLDKAGSSRSRQRGKPVQVQAKTPWGFIAGSSVLGLLLIGVVAYAVFHQGAGFVDPVEKADKAVEGVAVSTETLSRNHVQGPVSYPQTPPNGGDHNAQWQNCVGDVYTEPINNENAVHSMEHGAVWVTYKPDLPADQVSALREVVQGEQHALMSPLPEQKAAIDLSAWGRRLSVESASDPRVEDFMKTYSNGPQTPEKGAACGGGVTGTRASNPITAQAPPPVAPAPPPRSRCRPRRPPPSGPPHAREAPSRPGRRLSRVCDGPQTSGRPASRRTVAMSSSGSNGLVR